MKKNIIITGASSGFGKEIAKLFEKDGHNMLLLSRNEEKLKALGIKEATTRSLDVADPAAFNEIVDEWAKEVKTIDLVVNNAGVMYSGQIGTQDRSEFKRMIDTNIKGVINGIQATRKYMEKQKYGTIINISSVAGLKPFPNNVIYSATKAAVISITEGVRMELAPLGIRVTNIAPGAFVTNLVSNVKDKKGLARYEEMKKHLAPMPEPIEVAKIVKYVFDSPQNLNFREIVLHPTKQIS